MYKNLTIALLTSVTLVTASVEACTMNLGGFDNQIYHYYQPCEKVTEAVECKTVSITADKTIYFAKKDGSFLRLKSNGTIETAPDQDTKYKLDTNQDLEKYAIVADMVFSCQAGYRQDYLPLTNLTDEQLKRIGFEYYGKTDVERNKAHIKATAKAACPRVPH